MKLYDYIELAARNLRESVLRNSLTTLGISVGIAQVTALGTVRFNCRHFPAKSS
jgi:hypothetical protein